MQNVFLNILDVKDWDYFTAGHELQVRYELYFSESHDILQKWDNPCGDLDFDFSLHPTGTGVLYMLTLVLSPSKSVQLLLSPVGQ